MYTSKVFINCSDVDINKKIKPSSLFKHFQDVAVSSIETGDFNNAFLDKNNLMWVITRFNVMINDLPNYLDYVKFVTYPGKTKRIIYPRYFLVLDENDHVLVKVSSTWALLDKATRNIANVDEDFLKLDIDHLDDELDLPKKIKINEESCELKMSKVVRYSDCDLNGHLNNTRYIDFIFDLFSIDFIKHHQIKNIKIDYLSEIRENQQVDLYLCKENDIDDVSMSSYSILGKVEDKICFISRLDFKLYE